MKVVFLGYLKNDAGGKDFNLSPDSHVKTVEDLIALISGNNDALKESLSHPSVRVIINKSILAKSTLPQNIDEVAFMPPLSGG